jgi:hypothetical protein
MRLQQRFEECLEMFRTRARERGIRTRILRTPDGRVLEVGKRPRMMRIKLPTRDDPDEIGHALVGLIDAWKKFLANR